MSLLWQDVVAAKLAIRDAAIQHYHRKGPDELSNITAIDNAKDLTQRLESGQISAQDVVRAYISE
jgi:hypothetical protein